MDLTPEFLADILIGVARAQNALIDAIDHANPGFRNTHAVPILNVAANMRAGDPRTIDLPSRILLRLQGRVAINPAAVKADIERLSGGAPAATAAAPAPVGAAAAAAAAALDSLDFNVKL